MPRLLISAAALLCAFAFALNVTIGPEWIERLLHIEPDGGDGSLEALLTVAPGVAAVLLGALNLRLRRAAAPSRT